MIARPWKGAAQASCARGRRRLPRGQAVVEYLLMTTMLLFLFTGMYKLLQSNLKNYFSKAGQVILTAYY